METARIFRPFDVKLDWNENDQLTLFPTVKHFRFAQNSM